jgi:hypothetical protein
MQPDRLIHRQQLMEAILPRRANAQPEINLCKRSHRHSHGPMIVKSASQIYDAAQSGNSANLEGCERRSAPPTNPAANFSNLDSLPQVEHHCCDFNHRPS